MWPFNKRHTQDIKESERAILRAQDELRRVKSRTTEVEQISGSLRLIRERNHFAEKLRIIMERG